MQCYAATNHTLSDEFHVPTPTAVVNLSVIANHHNKLECQ